MKKYVIATILALTLMFSAALSACTSYSSKPGPMEKVVGTYELTEYLRTPDGGKESNELKSLNITAYIVVGDDGNGYYIYGDKNNELKCETTKVTYTYDDEDPSLIKAVKYTTGYLDVGTGYPGIGRETLGFIVDTSKKDKCKLSYNISNTKVKIFNSEVGDNFKANVTYTKVSKDTTLDYVEETLNTTFDAVKYELKRLGNFMQRSVSVSNFEEYVYYFVDFNRDDLTAKVYYAEVSDRVKREKTVDVTVTDKDGVTYVNIDGQEYKIIMDTYLRPSTYLISDEIYYDTETFDIIPDALDGAAFTYMLNPYTLAEDQNLDELTDELIEEYENLYLH